MLMFKKIDSIEHPETFLQGFIRYFETHQVYYIDGTELRIKDDHFIEDWPQEKLLEKALYLQSCLKNNGIVVVVMDNKQIVGFGNLEAKIYDNTYIQLPYLHVSKPYRGKGIGRTLFALLELEAKQMGAKKLYLSTHPSIEAQQFYQKMGCTLAQHIIPEIYALEPLDIQLEKLL